ncbi:MAG: plastocyanin/azurin family copper-binding protein [Actinomycetota bacterium]
MKRAGGLIVIVTILGMMMPARAADTSSTIGQGARVYTPSNLHIEVGDTVTWFDNDSRAPHTVTSVDGRFDSSPNGNRDLCLIATSINCLSRGSSWPHTFDTPGTYRFYCKIHGSAAPKNCGMCGTVVVSTKATQRPTHTPSPTKRATARPSATASATASGSAHPSPSPTDTTLAAPAGSKGGFGEGGRIGLALIVILALSGAAYYTWRRFILPSA